MRRHMLFYFYTKNSTLLHPNPPNKYKTLVGFFNTLVDHFSTSVSPNPTPLSLRHPLIVEHLINEYGVSRDKAILATKTFSRSTTVSDLTSVPEFLKQYGFSDTHIRKLIFKEPRLICSKIDKTLKPKLKFLQEQLGLSPSSFTVFIVHRPAVLSSSIEKCILPTINILRSMCFSSYDIIMVVTRAGSFGKHIGTHMNFLSQCGLTHKQISTILLSSPRIFNSRLDSLKYLVDRVEKFGITRNSPSFVSAFRVVGSLSEATIQERFKLYTSYGLSQSDILSAFTKAPLFLMVSEEKVRKIMSFLIDEHEFSPKDIALMPVLFTYSFEKRLKPRSWVLKILKSKGLLGNKPNLKGIVHLTEAIFLKDYVNKFADRVPEVQGYYISSGVQRGKEDEAQLQHETKD